MGAFPLNLEVPKRLEEEFVVEILDMEETRVLR